MAKTRCAIKVSRPASRELLDQDGTKVVIAAVLLGH